MRTLPFLALFLSAAAFAQDDLTAVQGELEVARQERTTTSTRQAETAGGLKSLSEELTALGYQVDQSTQERHKIADEMEVVVLEVDKENRRLSLMIDTNTTGLAEVRALAIRSRNDHETYADKADAIDRERIRQIRAIRGILGGDVLGRESCPGCVSSVATFHGLGETQEPVFLVNTSDPDMPAGAVPVDFRELLAQGPGGCVESGVRPDSDRTFPVCTALPSGDGPAIVVSYAQVTETVMALQGTIDPYSY